MKLAYLTDSQLRGNNPRHRIDDFHAAVIGKLREVLEIGRREEVDAYYHGGDFGDHPFLSFSIIDEAVDLIEAERKPFKVNPGQHDIVGHNAESVWNCTLGHIHHRSQYIKIMPPVEIIGGRWAAHAVPFSHEIEDYLVSDEFMARIEQYKDMENLVFVHGTLVKKPTIFKHVLWSDPKLPVATYFIGDYHPPQPLERNDAGSLFVAPGSLARIAALESNFERSVNMAIFDTASMEAKIIPLKNVGPGAEVFAVEQVRENKAYEQRITEFMATLDGLKLASLKTAELIYRVAEQAGIEKEIANELVGRLEETEKKK